MHASGPCPADIMIIGDSPDSVDTQRGAPYCGYSSQSFRRLLPELGFYKVYTTYAHEKFMVDSKKLYTAVSRMPDVSPNKMHNKKVTERCWKDKRRLIQEMVRVNPKIVILAGAYPLFLITGEHKAYDFRSSHWNIGGMDFVSTLNPYVLELKMSWIDLVRGDFQRVVRYLQEGIKPPQEEYEIFPEFGRVLEYIGEIEKESKHGPVEVTGDIETTPDIKALDCLGLSIKDDHAICIPFTGAGHRDRSTYSFDEELEIWYRLMKLFALRDVTVCGQNWQYDAVWLARYAGIVTKLSWDTMIAQHVLFAHLDKGLGFLGSLYSPYHKFWKDDRKGGKIGKEQEEAQWIYNCRDVLRTREIEAVQKRLIKAYGLESVLQRQLDMFQPVCYTMFIGHNIDHELRKQMQVDANKEKNTLIEDALYLLEEPYLNLDSPKQLKDLFYGELHLPEQYKGKGKKKTLSCDENSMKKFSEEEPLILPVTHRISDSKSLGKLLTGSLSSEYDADGRFRCCFQIPGTKTYRFASSADAFKMGTNAQNVTSGGMQNIIEIPNNRRIFTVDEGYLYFAIDLDRADAQVVAWEANDLPLKKAFADKVDIHNQNTQDIFGHCSGDKDPNRPKAKAGVHAVNYVVKARTLGMTLGISTKEAQHFIDVWFEKHPAIKDWHARVEMNLIEQGYIENAFGFRCYFKERIQQILSEAVAWAPQSTVANVTNQAYKSIHKRLPRHAQVLMQVHDELTGIIAIKDLEHTLPILRDCFNVVIPYEDPLIIPVGLKLSSIGWGDLQNAEGEYLEMWDQEIIK